MLYSISQAAENSRIIAARMIEKIKNYQNFHHFFFSPGASICLTSIFLK